MKGRKEPREKKPQVSCLVSRRIQHWSHLSIFSEQHQGIILEEANRLGISAEELAQWVWEKGNE